MCAHAVRVAMRKVPGIEDVHVSLEKAHTDVVLRPGNEVAIAQLREIIKNSGFKSGDAEITAQGRIVGEKDSPRLDLAPAPMTLRIREDKGDADALAEFRRVRGESASAIVEITGTLATDDSVVLKSVKLAQSVSR